MKVIFLNSFPLYDKSIELYAPGTRGFYLFGMGQFIAKEFLKRGYDINFEIWRMDQRINKLMIETIDNITCKIFPSKHITIIGEFSKDLISAFNEENNSIFHFIPNHKLNYNLFAYYLKHKNNNKIITSHIGGANPLWKWQKTRKIKNYLSYLFEKYIFNKYDEIISISKTEIDYYKNIGQKAHYMPQFGVPNIDIFNITNKFESKIKLGLPTGKKVLLQVGRAVEARGFDWILHLIDNLKNNDNYYFLFVGINKEDEYYKQLKNKNVHIVPYVKHTDLPTYYNAADILFYLPHGEMDLNFAGTSYVPLEALLCGTPVVATTMHHFPGQEINNVIKIPRKKEDVVPMLFELLNKNISRKYCRETVLKYYSWDYVIHKHWSIYNS